MRKARRRVFFSFDYGDADRAMVVRDSWETKGIEAAGFIDPGDFEVLKRHSDTAVQMWIDDELKGSSVTVVLVGKETCSSKWVKYEIKKSIEIGNGLLGINIGQIKDMQGKTTECCGRIPEGYNFYRWFTDNGYKNMGDWIEKAAKDAGR